MKSVQLDCRPFREQTSVSQSCPSDEMENVLHFFNADLIGFLLLCVKILLAPPGCAYLSLLLARAAQQVRFLVLWHQVVLGQQAIRFPLPPYTRGDKNVYEEQELNQSLVPLLANSVTTRPWLLGLECNERIELRCVQLKLNAPAVSSFAPERKKNKTIRSLLLNGHQHRQTTFV